MAASKAAAIANLVAELKAGKLSKEDLFKQLQELQASGGVPSSASASASRESPAAVALGPSAPRSDDGSPLDAAQQEAARAVEPQTARADPASLHRSYMAARAQVHTSASRDRVERSEREGADAARRSAATADATASFAAAARSRAQAQPPRSAATPASSGAPRSGAPSAHAHTQRAEAPATAAASRPATAPAPTYAERELAECTFAPSTTALPASYGSTARRVLSSVPFATRVHVWMSARDAAARAARAEAEARELENCTFKPAINPASKVVKTLRELGTPAGQGMPAHDRLFLTHTQSHANLRSRSASAGRLRPGSAPSTGLRIATEDAGDARSSRVSLGGVARHHLSGGRPLFSPTHGAGHVYTGSPRHGNYALFVDDSDDRPLTTAEERELAECTFHPKINRTYDARPVRSRFRESLGGGRPRSAGASSHHKAEVLPSGMEECTFQPKVNPVKSSVMPAIASYVHESVFDRLPSRQTRAQLAREQAVRHEHGKHAHGHTGGELHDTALDTNLSLLTGAPPAPASSKRNRSHGSSESAEERRRAMAEFLERQAAAEVRKKMHVEQLAQQLAPPLQPALCTRSLQIAESMRTGENFLERVMRDTARKEHETLKTKARLSRDPECTFAPAINPASKALPRRSAVQLSKGDALKRETMHRLLRLRAEQEALEGITFTPAINAQSREVTGRLRLREDPDSFLARIAQETAYAEERARHMAESQMQAELRECTFKPEVHDAPGYVKRIARSMAIARAVTSGSVASPSTRPEWR